VSEPYGKFRVIPRRGLKPDNQNYIVRINDMSELLDRVYNDMKVRVDRQNNVLAVNVVSGNANNGVDLIKKLIRLYNWAHRGTATSAAVEKLETKEAAGPQTHKQDANIAALRAKADRLRSEISSLEARKDNPSANDEDQSVTSTTDPAKMYQEMKSFVRKPVTEYVQVPHQDEIDDPDLNDNVAEYNDAQSYRHTLISNSQKNKGQIDSINRRLMVLQSQIVQELNADIKDAPAHHIRRRKPTDIKVLIREKRDELAKVDIDISNARKAGLKPVAKTAKIRHPKTKHLAPPSGQIAAPALAILDKPENNIKLIHPNYFLIYALAILFGLCIPVGWLAIRKIWNIGSNHTIVEKERITERIQDIFSVKQID
jgi:hypothetical protein